MGELTNEQRAIVICVQADYNRISDEIAERLQARPDPDERPLIGSEEFKCIVAQNVLRTCIEAALERMIPYAVETPVELALRMASYLISAIPIEAQEGAVAEFVRLFPETHRQRMAQGIHLQTGWALPGESEERANVPVSS